MCTPVTFDSFFITYSGARYCEFDYNNLEYLNVDYLRGSDYVSDLLNTIPQPNNLDLSYTPHINCDTIRYFTGIAFPASPWNEINTYNPDGTHNTVTRRFFDSTGQPSLFKRQIALYNNGKFSKVYDIFYNGTTPDTTAMRYFSYDSLGNVIKDSIREYRNGIYINLHFTIYTYDTNGRYLTRYSQEYDPVSNTNGYELHMTNIYYPDGNVQIRRYKVDNLFFFPISIIDSFGYTPGVAGYTSYKEIFLDSLGNPDGYCTTYTSHMNAMNVRDSVFFTQTKGGVPYRQNVYELIYNRYGNPAAIYLLDIYTACQLITAKYFYYELYNPTQVAGQHLSTIPSITIVPNPTTGIITLQYPEAKPGAQISIRITNASGQLVHTESIMMQGTSQHILLGNETAPGTYYLSVYGGKDELLCTKSVIKL